MPDDTNQERTLEEYKAENAALRQRIAELERLAVPPDQHRNPLGFWPSFFEDLPIPLQIYRLDGYLFTMNRVSEEYWQVSREAATVFNVLNDPQMIQQGIPDLVRRTARGEVIITPPTTLDTGETGLDIIEQRTNWLVGTYFPIYNREGEIEFVGITNRDITEEMERQQRSEAQLQSEREFIDALLNTTSLLVAVFDRAGRIVRFNQAAEQLTGYTFAEIEGRATWDVLLPPEDKAMVQATFPQLQASMFPNTYEGYWVTRRGERRLITWNSSALLNAAGEVEHVVATGLDITTRKHEEEERAALQEQLISAQQAAIRELSTPLLPIADHVVALPLVGTIDSARAQLVMETLLEGIAARRATIAIIDITGVQVVDTQVAQALLQAARAARLLGAQVVLTGIQPTIAQMLVHLGAELGGLVTRSTLQAGIAYALGRAYIDHKVDKDDT